MDMNNKRKKTHDFQMTRKKYSGLGLEEENITLSLSTPMCPELQPPLPLSQQPPLLFQPPPQSPLQLSPSYAVCIPPPSPSPAMSSSSSSAPTAAHRHEAPPAQQLHPPSIPALLLQLQPQVPILSPSHEVGIPPPSGPLPRHSSTPSSAPAAVLGSAHRQETGPSRARRNPTQVPREGKGDTVPAPFPWATTRRATVHSLKDLQEMRITAVSGEVQCKRCEGRYEMEYDLHEKFREVGTFIAGNKIAMRDRAPQVWMNPVLPSCKVCHQENCVKPVVSEKKKAINWLFLLLGQLLGCCTLEQLKYFCKHTKKHRTGAKDRVLFLTYLGLCKQLDPQGPFDR